MSFSKSTTMELLKDFPTVLAYLMAIYLFLKKETKNSHSGKNITFNKAILTYIQ